MCKYGSKCGPYGVQISGLILLELLVIVYPFFIVLAITNKLKYFVCFAMIMQQNDINSSFSGLLVQEKDGLPLVQY